MIVGLPLWWAVERCVVSYRACVPMNNFSGLTLWWFACLRYFKRPLADVRVTGLNDICQLLDHGFIRPHCHHIRKRPQEISTWSQTLQRIHLRIVLHGEVCTYWTVRLPSAWNVLSVWSWPGCMSYQCRPMCRNNTPLSLPTVGASNIGTLGGV